MNFLSYPSQLQRAFEALGLTILHSLWQGLVLMVLLWTLLHFIRYEKAKLRFILAFGTLMLMLLAFATTFYDEWDSLKPQAVVSQSFNTENIVLTDLQVSSETNLWEQIKFDAYRLFYQVAENASLLAMAWLAGSLLFSLRLSLGLWQIHQLRQERQALPEFWKSKTRALQQALHIRRSVEVSTNSSLDTPITLGWLKPMILLPASMLTAMPADQLESILVHELAHIRRHDYLWNLLQSITEVILFYHPAYWYIALVLEQEREHACDAITLKITGRPQVYAQALLQVASLRTTLSTVGLSARGRSGFAERIRRIVAPQQKKKGVQPLPFLLSFCLIGFLLFAFTLKAPFEEQTAHFEDVENTLTYDSLRTPDYVDYSKRWYENTNIPLYRELAKYSSDKENHLVGKASSSEEDINPWIYFKEEALYLLDGKVVDEPESIMMSEIAKVEVYHEPLPASLQNLSDRAYATVVRVLSEIPAAEAERSTIPVSGLVQTRKDGKIIPVPNIPVQVQSTGEQTLTDQNGRYRFSSVGKKDTLLFYVPYHEHVTKAEVDGREHISVYTYIPRNKKQPQNQTFDKLKQRMRPEKLKQDREAIDSRIGLMDSSIYDVIKDIISIDPKTNTTKIKSDVPASQNDLSTYYTIGDPEVLFTLDGIVTDPRTVDRKLVDGASFETQNVPDGYLVVIKAVSQKAADAARKESLKTIVRGTVTDKNTGKPLAGTFILVKGSTTPTVSDLQGKYQIELPKGSGELVFAYEGYETRIEPIKNSKILEIALLPEAEQEELDRKKAIIGRVTDAETGQPVLGANVLLSGTTIGTVTDINGRYQLRMNDNAESLLLSAPGYLHTQVLINKATILNVKLSSDDMNVNNSPLDLDSTLIIIDDLPREDLKSIEDIELNTENIKSMEVRKDNSAYEYMTEAQKKRYNAVIKIYTKNSSVSHHNLLEETLKVFPNPSNDQIKVNFSVQEASSVAFELLDKEGKLLHEVAYHYDDSGNYEVIIPSKNFPPDTYLLRVSCNGESEVRRVILK